MKRILIITLLSLIFTIGVVSGLDFDNVKSYDEEKREITVVNSFGLGDDIATIKLNTPIIYKVMRGKDRLVAEFTIENYENYNNVLKEMEFFDLENRGRGFNREFTYKYWVKTGEKTVQDFNNECDLVTQGNGTKTNVCNRVNTGSHTEDIFSWVQLEQAKRDQLSTGNITIGIFTDVSPNERVEWIPTMFGVRIDEWAIWDEAMSDQLVAYYEFEETSGGGGG